MFTQLRGAASARHAFPPPEDQPIDLLAGHSVAGQVAGGSISRRCIRMHSITARDGDERASKTPIFLFRRFLVIGWPAERSRSSARTPPSVRNDRSCATSPASPSTVLAP